MDQTNEVVLKTVEQEVLHPEVVRRALRRVLGPSNSFHPVRAQTTAELVHYAVEVLQQRVVSRFRESKRIAVAR